MLRLTIEIPSAVRLEEISAALRLAAAVGSDGDPAQQLLALRWAAWARDFDTAARAAGLTQVPRPSPTPSGPSRDSRESRNGAAR